MSESLETLRAWFAENKATPEVLLALKHRTAMDPAVTAELMARAPGETDEEKELGFLFALAQVADKLDALAVLTAGIRVEHLPAVEKKKPAKSEKVAASHVDVIDLTVDSEPAPSK